MVVAARLRRQHGSRVAGIARRRQRQQAAGRRRVSRVEVVAVRQWRRQHGKGFAATAVPAWQEGGPNHCSQTARRPTVMTAMDSVTAKQPWQKAQRRCNGDGNSDDGDIGDNSDNDGNGDEDNGDGDGRCDGDTTATAAMGGATAHNWQPQPLFLLSSTTTGDDAAASSSALSPSST